MRARLAPGSTMRGSAGMRSRPVRRPWKRVAPFLWIAMRNAWSWKSRLPSASPVRNSCSSRPKTPRKCLVCDIAMRWMPCALSRSAISSEHRVTRFGRNASKQTVYQSFGWVGGCMIPLDISGRPPAPDTSGKTEGTSSSSLGPDQSDFSRWLAPESDQAAKGMSEQGSTNELTVVATPLPASSDTSDLAVVAGVLYSWQLHSQPFLSQIGSASVMAAGSSLGMAAMAPHPTQALLGVVGLVGGQEVAIAAVNAPESGNRGPASAAAVSSMRSIADSNPQESVAGAIASASWTERMLRSVESPNRSITLWLRDYRLGQSEVSAAVDELLRAHPDSGRIVRVVVNGREAWRKQSLESRSE